MSVENLKNRLQLDQHARVVIVGLGITGVSVARYLNHYAIPCIVVDSRDNPPSLVEFSARFPQIPVITGGFKPEIFANATHLSVSPGISLQLPIIQSTLARGIAHISDIDLLACSVSAPIVAITGSNGKSTVTTMVGAMAQACGRNVGVGGNLGTPALDLIQPDIDLYVLELSSFQLERTRLLQPAAATVLNISADHLDRHIDLADYAYQKQSVLHHATTAVLNSEDLQVDAMRAHCPGQVLTFGVATEADFHVVTSFETAYLFFRQTRLMPMTDLPLEGLHNVANALAALALGYAVGLNLLKMCDALRHFVGLAHRMQKVADIDQVTWINDSKATNIGACAAALQGYKQPVILIAGGDAKGADMQELAPVIKAKVKAVILIGKDAPLIKQAIEHSVPTFDATTIQHAVQLAAQQARCGDTVLLSPACASLDQFRDYKDRGEQFTRAVLALGSQITS